MLGACEILEKIGAGVYQARDTDCRPALVKK